ncbi:MAG TPA: hypothetical protein VK809_09820 [Bacteroidia bacterium]|nr:hypothetical protein [Bacteroidia bacterium]
MEHDIKIISDIIVNGFSDYYSFKSYTTKLFPKLKSADEGLFRLRIGSYVRFITDYLSVAFESEKGEYRSETIRTWLKRIDAIPPTFVGVQKEIEHKLEAVSGEREKEDFLNSILLLSKIVHEEFTELSSKLNKNYSGFLEEKKTDVEKQVIDKASTTQKKKAKTKSIKGLKLCLHEKDTVAANKKINNFLKELEESGFIDSKHTSLAIRNAFTGGILKEEINWIKGQNVLRYLILLLKNEPPILKGNDKLHHWRRAAECFVFNGEAKKPHNISSSKEPKDTDAIERINDMVAKLRYPSHTTH